MFDSVNLSSNDYYKITSSEGKIKFLLQYAILAPSTHNTQPWLFKIVKNECLIYINKDKLLIEGDKNKKNLYLSLGACIENLIISAKYFKVYKNIDYILKGDLVARISFKENLISKKKNLNYKTLFNAISQRVTTRGIYSNKTVASNVIQELFKVQKFSGIKLYTFTNKKEINKIAKLTGYAVKSMYSNKSFRNELSQWINGKLNNKREGIPALALRLPYPLLFIFPLIIKYLNIGSIVERINYISMNSMPLILLISVSRIEPRILLQAGQYIERILLLLTSKKIDTYINIASVESEQTLESIKNITSTNLQPIFVFGAGYSNLNKVYSMRIEVEEKLVS